MTQQIIPSKVCVAGWLAAALSVTALPAVAQGLPTTMQATTLTMPSGMTGYPMAINSAGQVGGFATKAAGSVLKVGTRYTGPFASRFLYWDPQAYLYPVLWTQGTPSLPARYKSNLNTTLVGEGATGSWVALSTNTSAKLSLSTVNTEAGRTLGSMTSLLLTNGVYTPLSPAGVTFVEPPAVNRKGTMAGTATSSAAGAYDITVVRNGQPSRIPMPTGLFSWVVVGLSDDDQVLLSGEREELYTMQGDTPVYTQYRWQRRCFLWRAGTLTEVTVPSPQPAISVDCKGMGSDGLVAGFVAHLGNTTLQPYGLTKAMFTWRNGQLDRFQTPFEVYPSDYLPRVSLTAGGWGVYAGALGGQSPDGQEPRVFSNGIHRPMRSLVQPALLDGESIQVKSVHGSGQVLATISPPATGGVVRHVVLSPR